MNQKKLKKSYLKQQEKQKRNKRRKKISYKVFFYNVFAFLIVLVLLNVLISKNSGYNWMWNTLIGKNLEMIAKNKNLSIAQKNEAKQGFFFKYLNFINANTPDSAIILMPPDSIILGVDKKLKLKFLSNRRITTYFIYPRKAVYEKDKEYDRIYMDRITHIAIVNYYGYEKLNYVSSNKQQFSILPLNQK